MKSGIIVTGGSIDEQFALSFIQRISEDAASGTVRVIAADRGLLFCRKTGIRPAYIVGDFDSAGKQILEDYLDDPEISIHPYRPEKDWTDTEIAVKLAIGEGMEHIWLIGGTGSRLDHVLGNVQVLAMALSAGVSCEMLDPHNRVWLSDCSFELKKEEQWGTYVSCFASGEREEEQRRAYVSLFAYGGPVKGLTLEGFRYPLQDYTLGCEGSLGVSNEIVEESARVSFQSGRLLCIESRD